MCSRLRLGDIAPVGGTIPGDSNQWRQTLLVGGTSPLLRILIGLDVWMVPPTREIDFIQTTYILQIYIYIFGNILISDHFSPKEY